MKNECFSCSETLCIHGYCPSCDEGHCRECAKRKQLEREADAEVAYQRDVVGPVMGFDEEGK